MKILHQKSIKIIQISGLSAFPTEDEQQMYFLGTRPTMLNDIPEQVTRSYPFIPVPCSVGIGNPYQPYHLPMALETHHCFGSVVIAFQSVFKLPILELQTCGKLILTQSDPILTNKSKQSWTHVEQICTNIMAAPCGPPEHPNPWGSLSSVASGKQYARVVSGDFFAKKQLLTKMLSAVSTAGNTLRYLDSTCRDGCAVAVTMEESEKQHPHNSTHRFEGFCRHVAKLTEFELRWTKMN